MSSQPSESTEHRRLVEKWVYENLSDEELARQPEELKRRVQGYFQGLIAEAVEDVRAGRVVDGPSALERMREGLRGRKG